MSAKPKPKKAEKSAGGVVTRSLERRREIVRAAYETIAERGFEGLRMREVANRAGMNHATLITTSLEKKR
jgi:AcrR family transcriptional regulator